MFKYIIEDTLLKEEMKKVKERLKNKEGSDIMHVHEVLRRDREKYAQGIAKEAKSKTIYKIIKTRYINLQTYVNCGIIKDTKG